jgi:hypothetical protein
MTPILGADTNISEEHTPSIFRVTMISMRMQPDFTYKSVRNVVALNWGRKKGRALDGPKEMTQQNFKKHTFSRNDQAIRME